MFGWEVYRDDVDVLMVDNGRAFYSYCKVAGI